ncbi:MAG: Thymidylate synthase [Chrysothrix sp. TS-e1954]|nr:MAG: Thymidylate synthase [Chrysothrix sp. TS-e1954]
MDMGLANGPNVTLSAVAETLDFDPPDRDSHPYRTGTGTYSLFAPRQLRFSLSKTKTDSSGFTPILPLLTTKRVFLRAVLAELLWFVSGSTSALDLSSQGVHIWDGNGSREYLDGVGLIDHSEGDLGPVYGFQWRHFGAEYKNASTDYKGQGIDQLAEVVRKLRETPFDRRIILSAWNPADLKRMALPPCHMFAQFYVSFPSKTRRRADHNAEDKNVAANGANNGAAVDETLRQQAQHKPSESEEQGVLHTVLYQRSCDMGLGVPFNIASYALLAHMLAHVCDLIPGTLTHTMGDAHVYLNHVDALEGQMLREPREFPTLEIRRPGGKGIDALDGWSSSDFEIIGYEPHKAVAMKMSV